MSGMRTDSRLGVSPPSAGDLSKRSGGPRTVLARTDQGYPSALERAADPPERLYVAGAVDALEEGIAIVGARRSTPYGLGCAARFARAAAEHGVLRCGRPSSRYGGRGSHGSVFRRRMRPSVPGRA